MHGVGPRRRFAVGGSWRASMRDGACPPVATTPVVIATPPAAMAAGINDEAVPFILPDAEDGELRPILRDDNWTKVHHLFN